MRMSTIVSRIACQVFSWLAVASVLAWSAAHPPAARADGDLKGEILRQVGIIQQAMRGATDIQVKEFDCGSTDELNGHVGPGLKAAYEEAFQAAKIQLNDQADHVLSGQFFTTSRKLLEEKKPLRLTIKLALTKRDGETPVVLLPIDAPLDAPHFATVNSTKDLARAIGFTGGITADAAGAAKRQEEIAKQVLEPKAVIDGSRMRSGPNSEYELEVRKRSHGAPADFTPVTPVLESGVLVAAIGLNEEYELRVVNRSKLPVAVAVTVDGLDVFHFSDPSSRDKEGKPQFTHFIVYPNGERVDGVKSDGTSLVPGWFQKLAPPNNYLSFLVTEHGKGAISRVATVPRDKVGAIHVQFSHCQPLSDKATAKSGTETGFGMPRDIEQKAVRFQIEPPHDFITVRYQRPQK